MNTIVTEKYNNLLLNDKYIKQHTEYINKLNHLQKNLIHLYTTNLYSVTNKLSYFGFAKLLQHIKLDTINKKT